MADQNDRTSSHPTQPHPMADAICAEALSWLGTSFVHQACCKGAGVDCAGLVVGVARALGLLPPGWQVPPYDPAWHLHHGGELLQATLEACGGRVLATVAEAQPGDVLLMKFRGHLSHGHIALLLPGERLVHAVYPKGVVTQSWRGLWEKSIGRAARLPLPGGRVCPVS